MTSFEHFLDGGFIVLINFEKMKISEGALQVKLQFDEVQKTKRVFLWMPVYDRKLIIDRNLDVAVE